MDSTWLQNMIARISSGFVLAFHEIPAARMELFLDTLSPVRVLHLSELVDRAKSGRSTAGLCAITVDDGVSSTVEGVTGLCGKRGWPVTFYLATGNIDTGAGMAYEWWRRIAPLLPGKRLELASGTLDFFRQEAVWELSSTLERLWHTAPLEDYRPFTMELVKAVARQERITIDDLRPEPSVTWERVAELSKDDLFRFESHGISHVAVSALSGDDLVSELKRSRDAVSEHTGRECRHFAYPFGSSRSIGPAAPAVARSFYDSAVTMRLGPVDASDPYLLPRIPLYPENSTFLARLKVALRCSRLSVSRRKRGYAGQPLAGGTRDIPAHQRSPQGTSCD